MSTEKKVAFITGANRGLGLQTARELGRLGIVVVIGSRDPEKGKAAAATLRSEGIAAESLRCDVTKPEDRRAVWAGQPGRSAHCLGERDRPGQRLSMPNGEANSLSQCQSRRFALFEYGNCLTVLGTSEGCKRIRHYRAGTEIPRSSIVLNHDPVAPNRHRRLFEI